MILEGIKSTQTFALNHYQDTEILVHGDFVVEDLDDFNITISMTGGDPYLLTFGNIGQCYLPEKFQGKKQVGYFEKPFKTGRVFVYLLDKVAL